jgi:hypothetical protein
MSDERRTETTRHLIERAWEKFFDDADLVHGTSGNVIDDMKQAFEAGWQAFADSMETGNGR